MVNMFKAGAVNPKSAKIGSTVEASGYLFVQRDMTPFKQEVAIGCLQRPLGANGQAAATPMPPASTTAEVGPGTDASTTGKAASQGGDSDPDALRRVIVGEEQCRDADGKPLDFFAEVNSAEMARIQLPKKGESSSTMITAFLEGALKRGGNSLGLDIDGIQRCRPETDMIQTVIAQATQQGRILQPVFLSELAAVIQAYAYRAAGRMG
jgi:hypothetical protein